MNVSLGVDIVGMASHSLPSKVELLPHKLNLLRSNNIQPQGFLNVTLKQGYCHQIILYLQSLRDIRADACLDPLLRNMSGHGSGSLIRFLLELLNYVLDCSRSELKHSRQIVEVVGVLEMKQLY